MTPDANVQLIRQAMRDVLAALPPAVSPLQGMQRILLGHACDARYRPGSALRLRSGAASVCVAAALAAMALPGLRTWVFRVALVAEDSGGTSFDEACSLPWLRLSQRFPQASIPLAGMSTTIELGGQADTGRDAAVAHAEGILAFLAEQGLIDGEWPAALHEVCEAMPFEGTELLYAPHAGVVSYLCPVGSWVEPGEPLFEVIDPLSDRASTICAGTAGVLFAVERLRYAQPAIWLAKVAGREPLRHGRLLSD